MARLIHVGVLAHRDPSDTCLTWQPTADYLNRELATYHFVIVPLNFQQIGNAVDQNSVDFLISSPGLYVEFEALYGLNRLATLKRVRMGQPYTVFGGVVFCRADRTDIQTLADLRGKTFLAAAENSFGGWRMAWRELVEAGLDPYRDFQNLTFRNSHDAVVYALEQGQADAGTVSTNVLEQMALEGKIDPNAFKVINQQTQYGSRFPFALSTRLYPEWPFAATHSTQEDLAEQVAIALLKLPSDHAAAIAARSAGWTIPLNYQPIHECFQVLQVHPYKDFGKTNSSFQLAVKGSNDGLWDWNLETNEVFFSARWKEMLGYCDNELPNQFEEWEQRFHEDDRSYFFTALQQYFSGQRPTFELEYRLRHRNGSYLWVLCRAALLRDVWGKPYRMAGSHTDITQRKQAEEELRQSELQLKAQTQQLQQTLDELQQTQLQLIHSEKMSGLGQMVAGVAHEINNPLNFIHGNLSYLDEYVDSLLKLAHTVQQHYPNPVAPVHEAMQACDLVFIQADLPQMMQSIRLGTERIREIVRSLRNFSRLDEATLKKANIHEGIDNTLLILQHRLTLKEPKQKIKIQKNYGTLPLVECYPGQLNQVFMNILSNAIDTLEDKISEKETKKHEKCFQDENIATPMISIHTVLIDESWASIRIIDNGDGMTENIRLRIFDPFFTTKPVGQGTGLGLSISYQIVVKQHGGELHCYSQPQKGTEFEIKIPLK